MPKLTARAVTTLKDPGMYGDGEGLYLRIGPNGAKSWILRTVVHKHRRELGLGSASLKTLAEARHTARHYRKIAREGGDPDTERKRETLTFEEAVTKVYNQLLPTWKNRKHAETWLATVESHANTAFGKRPIASITTADVLKILMPIWTTKHETAKRLMQRISTIFDWAKGAGHYPHENPVNGIKKALPVVKSGDNHMPALPWKDVPAFMAELAGREAISARTLEFIILTAVRSGEARGARWQEINFSEKTWTIPGQRMKRGIEHRVPLNAAALAVLDKMKGLHPDLVFPSTVSAKNGAAKEQSDMVFKALYQRMEREGFTTHGFRSAFRDWCGECAHVAREIAEAALAHAIGNSVERAYARSDLFERRRALMDSWGSFVAEVEVGNVVNFAGAK